MVSIQVLRTIKGLMMDIAAFIEALPAGEWTDLAAVSPDGMMARRNWAYLLRGRWLKAGGQDVFIKYLIEAGEDAGEDTNALTSEERLRRVHTRISRIAALGKRVPLVRILDAKICARPLPGLLVAMEVVTPLHDEIVARRTTKAIALSVLRSLSSPSAAGLSFHHFDVCPQNIGLSQSGEPLFIDPESFFLVEPEGVGVTTPAWKRPRAPVHLVHRVDGAFAEQKPLPVVLTQEKMNFELAVVAAECCLGPMPFLGQATFGSGVLGAWMDSPEARANPGLASFWYEVLSQVLATGQVPPPETMIEALAAVEPGGAAPRPQVPTKPALVGSLEWQGFWIQLQPIAARLRGGLLNQHQIEEYLGTVEALAAANPQVRELWLEVLLICVSFLKSRSDAFRVALKAQAALPGDQEISQLVGVIRLWGKDRFDGAR